MYAAPSLSPAPEDPHKTEVETDTSKPDPGVGSHFRQLRRARKLTQEELAKRSGLAVDTICRLESSTFSPTYVTLKKLARALAIPLPRLIQGSELHERDMAAELAWMIDALDEEQRAIFFTLVWQLHGLVSGAPASMADGDAAAQLGQVPATIGRHVKSLRCARGMTQGGLAERAGFSKDTLRRLERGRSTSFNVVRSAASALGLSLSAFFTSYELPARTPQLSLEWMNELEPAAQVCMLRATEQLRLMLTPRRRRSAT